MPVFPIKETRRTSRNKNSKERRNTIQEMHKKILTSKMEIPRRRKTYVHTIGIVHIENKNVDTRSIMKKNLEEKCNKVVNTP